MMPWFHWTLMFALGLLVAAMGCAVLRLLKGPHAQDRVLALDCMYLNGMLAMLLMGIIYDSTSYFEAVSYTHLTLPTICSV